MVTITRSVLRSLLTSSTLPEKFVNGPSTILTVSFFSNLSFGRGLSALVDCRNRTEFTSSAVSGTGLVPPPTKPCHPRSRFHRVPEFVVHFHFHQHVARIEHALAGDLFAVAKLNHFFGRDQQLANAIGKTKCLGTGAQRFGNLLLKTGVSVDDVPVLLRACRHLSCELPRAPRIPKVPGASAGSFFVHAQNRQQADSSCPGTGGTRWLSRSPSSCSSSSSAIASILSICNRLTS